MNHRSVLAAGFLSMMVLASTAALAGPTPVRKASENGVNSSQPQMNLFGPTQPLPKSDTGVSFQVVCPQQDVAGASNGDLSVFPGDTDSFKKSGTCLKGLTKFLFQVQPTKKTLKKVTVTLTGLVGFVPATDPDLDGVRNPTYGVQVCDDGGNTLELCTNLPDDQLPVIDATVGSKNTRVTFTVKNLSPTTVPAGVDYEGQGLTFEVVTQQVVGTPIAVPRISVGD